MDQLCHARARRGANSPTYASAPRCSTERSPRRWVNQQAPTTKDTDDAYSLEDVHLEYPAAGSGDLNPAALTITDHRGSHVARLLYAGHRVIDGKPDLGDMPSTYVEHPGEAKTLEITLADERLGLSVQLLYTIYAALPVITRSVKVTAAARSSSTPGSPSIWTWTRASRASWPTTRTTSASRCW
ncbi:MAG: glycoside hydrolase family 36 N-terminal domain-containing protein [Bifidobacterium scardovii]|uniref:glycoside hydrolase family 36 N-terminal domain-containing protein n=1 Tax=Bifidobacterium scardovii TaxID=158787 RepID=UPI00290544E8|nr:glycoside hydrolase family 36 N-terminal domain-containing protein [Bifidobacterium scardovii]MDU2421057.1 glycoside hydrolase family 36 N-terminal domain-containing protein [Bifidobacterium scardovii]